MADTQRLILTEILPSLRLYRMQILGAAASVALVGALCLFSLLGGGRGEATIDYTALNRVVTIDDYGSAWSGNRGELGTVGEKQDLTQPAASRTSIMAAKHFDKLRRHLEQGLISASSIAGSTPSRRAVLSNLLN